MKTCTYCRAFALGFLALALVNVVTLPVWSAVITWDSGGTTDNWNDGVNWSSNAVPTTADEAKFDTTATGSTEGTSIVTANATVQKLSFGGTGAATTQHALTINSGVTLRVDGDGTTGSNGGLDLADFNVGNDFSVFSGTNSVTLTVSGAGTLQIGAAGANTADVVLGRRRSTTGGGSGGVTVNLNLSGLAVFNANVDEFAVAHSGFDGPANTTLTLGPSTTVKANLVNVGDAANHGAGSATINLGQATTLNANDIHIGRKKMSATMKFNTGLTNPTLTIANLAGTGAANLFIGNNEPSTGTTPSSLLDTTGGTLNANLNNLTIGKFGGGAGSGSGELKMSAGTVTANSVLLASAHSSSTTPANTKGTLTMSGGSVTVNGNISDGGGTSTLNINGGTLTVRTSTTGGGLANVDALNLGSGATLGVEIIPVSFTRFTTTTATLAGGSLVTVTPRTVATFSNAAADQTAWIGGTGTWDTTPSNWHRGLPSGYTINTGDSFTFLQAGTLTDGGIASATAGWTVAVTPGANGTASVTRSGAAISSGPVRAAINNAASIVSRNTNLTIAEQATGVDAAMLEISAGSFTMNGANVTLGGAASAGQMLQTGGTFTLTGNVVDGGGTTSILMDGGTANVTGNLSVDNLRVGHNGRTANLTVVGDSARIGGGTSHNLFVGRRDIDTGSHAVGTLDLTAVAAVDVNVNRVDVGVVPGSFGAGQGNVGGTLRLGETNTIQASGIWIADSPSVGIGSYTSRIALGETNTVTATTLVVGGSKGVGVLDFLAPGSTLNLGASAQRADVLVGYQSVSTGGGSTGTMNLAGSAVNAFLDELVIGSKPNDATGTTAGTVTFDAGSMDVNSIVLARRTNAGTGGTVRGTFNLQGTGELTAGSITKSVNANTATDTVQFNFTGGTLHVGAYGTAVAPMDLVQTGGVLAPGNSVGTTTIYGNYNQGPSGILEIELQGLGGVPGTDFDFLNVSGNAVLGGTLQVVTLAGFTPDLSATFDVLTAPDIDISSLLLDASLSSRGFTAMIVAGGNGEILRLSAVPEPAAWMLLAMGAAAVAISRIRRGKRRA